MASETVTPPRPEIYDTFEAFLRAAIRDYYDLGWKSRPGRFLALLIASGQTMSLAADSVRSGEGLKKAAIGAAGVVALRYGLKFALGGPLGIILTGASAVSLGAYLLQHRGDVTEKTGVYRQAIADSRTRYEEIQGGYRGGRYDARERNLMVDGLMKNFLETLDA
jgi:hypothetical protein